MQPNDLFPDDQQIARLTDVLHSDKFASGRIGLGLRALYNHSLFESLPAEFKRLVDRLDRSGKPAKDPNRD